MPDAMVRGSLVHEAVAAYWRAEEPRVAVATKVVDYIDLYYAGQLPDALERKVQVQKLGREALSMTDRYIQTYAQGLYAEQVETSISRTEGPTTVSGTPDAILIAGDQRHILELKTSDNPNISSYNVSGQADLYAYLDGNIQLLRLVGLSPTSVVELTRPPRVERGRYLFTEAALLATKYQQEPNSFAALPHYSWRCTSCPYFEACKVRDERGDDEDVLLQTCHIDETYGQSVVEGEVTEAAV